MKLGTLSIILFLSACSSTGYQNNIASNQDGAVNDNSVNTTQTEDKLICKRTQATGTRFTEKTCLKRSVWEAARQESRAKLREVSQRATHSNPSGG